MVGSRAIARTVAAALPLTLLVLLSARPLPAQQASTPAAFTAQVAAAASWPHTIKREGATVTVYQPQAIVWPDRKRLSARAALSITRPGQSKPLMGTIELTLATTVDDATGVVNLSDPQLTSSHFPALDTQQAAALEARIRQALAQMQIRQVPLPTVLLSLKQLPVASLLRRSPREPRSVRRRAGTGPCRQVSSHLRGEYQLGSVC